MKKYKLITKDPKQWVGKSNYELDKAEGIIEKLASIEKQRNLRLVEQRRLVRKVIYKPSKVGRAVVRPVCAKDIYFDPDLRYYFSYCIGRGTSVEAYTESQFECYADAYRHLLDVQVLQAYYAGGKSQ